MKAIRSSLKQFVFMLLTFAVAAAVYFYTKSVYANAFFYNCKHLLRGFCQFLAIDIFRWIDLSLSEGGRLPSKKQEIMLTVMLLIDFIYALWLHKNRYSLWQLLMTAIVAAVILAGLALKLFGKYDVNKVRWLAWAGCCAIVSAAAIGCIVIFKPLTMAQAEQLIAAENGKEYIFNSIHNSRRMESPLGYYIFSEVDGEMVYGSGTGRAVLYFGENEHIWRYGKNS
ncbi:MAG: hypothetical protein J6C75_00245 [Oscillospiraceae bacterium]|nr:hypothetical protein [Oscillospiraceae bacterium]